LLKRYVDEPRSSEARGVIAEAESVGTARITRAEMSAAIAKAYRLGWLDGADAALALQRFRSHWTSLYRIRVSEDTVARADLLAWEYGLRGYDAVHLAAAHIWAERIRATPAFATFDRQLWRAANDTGLIAWPPRLVEGP
jgi:predicted nucleic acid-binding protein